MSIVPEKLINFRVYNEGADLLGVADVELPEITYMTETVKGAGIAGEVESPVLGHLGSMSLKLNWRMVVRPVLSLTAPKVHALDLRGANQTYDSAKGEYKVSALRVAVRCIPKKTGTGKLDVGAKADTTNEFEVVYMKISIDGKDYLEVDKYNYICVVEGTDYLKDVRGALGL